MSQKSKTVWEPKPKTPRKPYGYLSLNEFLEKGGDPDLPSSFPNPEEYIYPDPVVLSKLDEALDQLDAGISYREAVEWLNNQVPELSLSHEGIKKIRARVRPNHPKKIPLESHPGKKRMTRLERQVYNRKRKIARDKQRLAAVKNRIEKQQEGIQELLEENDPKKVIIEIPTEEYDYESIPEEDVVIFKPNPGPQTQFLAATETEVLYGGSAGGEPKPGFFRLLSQ